MEGLELLNEESDTNTEIAPKAMLIHTGNSDVSMSGISTASKSTTGSVRWNDEAEDKERTSESMKQIKQQKIENAWVKYDIKLEEVQKWINEHVRDKKDRRYKMDTKQLQESMEYETWKDIMVWTKKERKRNYKRQTDESKNKKNDEFHDPIMDEAIRQIPSSEFQNTQTNNTTDTKNIGVSHPQTRTLSLPQKKSSREVKSEGQ